MIGLNWYFSPLKKNGRVFSVAPESDSEIEAGVCSVKALHEIMLPATNLNQLKLKFSDKIQKS